MVAAAGTKCSSGALSQPSPCTFQEERQLLECLNMRPMTKPLKMFSQIKKHKESMANSSAVQLAVAATRPVEAMASSFKKTLDKVLPPLVAYMPKFGGKQKQVRKSLIQ